MSRLVASTASAPARATVLERPLTVAQPSLPVAKRVGDRAELGERPKSPPPVAEPLEHAEGALAGRQGIGESTGAEIRLRQARVHVRSDLFERVLPGDARRFLAM